MPRGPFLSPLAAAVEPEEEGGGGGGGETYEGGSMLGSVLGPGRFRFESVRFGGRPVPVRFRFWFGSVLPGPVLSELGSVRFGFLRSLFCPVRSGSVTVLGSRFGLVPS